MRDGGKAIIFDPETFNIQGIGGVAHGRGLFIVVPTWEYAGEDWDVGHLYSARVTPHMMIVGPDGTLIYNGAIDDNPSTRPESLEGAHNYIAAALDESMSGREVTVPLTQPYG